MQQIIAAHPGLPAQRIDGVAAERSRKVMGRDLLVRAGPPARLQVADEIAEPAAEQATRRAAAEQATRPPRRRSFKLAPEPPDPPARPPPRPARPRSAAPHRRGPLKAL